METGDIAQKPYNRGMLLAEKHPNGNMPYLSYSYTKYVAVCRAAEHPIWPGSVNAEEGGVCQQVLLAQLLLGGLLLHGFTETPLPPGSNQGSAHAVGQPRPCGLHRANCSHSHPDSQCWVPAVAGTPSLPEHCVQPGRICISDAVKAAFRFPFEQPNRTPVAGCHAVCPAVP